jgi:hypothetical protein
MSCLLAAAAFPSGTSMLKLKRYSVLILMNVSSRNGGKSYGHECEITRDGQIAPGALFTARTFRQKLYTLFRSDPRGATANDPFRQKNSVRDHTFPASIMIRSGVGLRVYC